MAFPEKGTDIHVFWSVCSDNRNRSTRLENAVAMIMKKYSEAGDRVFLHPIESVGAALFDSEIDEIGRQIAYYSAKSKETNRPIAFFVEVVAHGHLEKFRGKTVLDKDCVYNCEAAEDSKVCSGFRNSLLQSGSIDLPKMRDKPRKMPMRDLEDLARFLQVVSGSAKNNLCTDSRPHSSETKETIIEYLELQHARIERGLSAAISRKELSLDGIRTYVTDTKDFTITQITGKPDGWNEKVYSLAALEKKEIAYSLRSEPANFDIMAIAHPQTIRRTAIPLAELTGLPRHMIIGRVYACTSLGLEEGRINLTVQASLFQFASVLGGKTVHIRGRDQDETFRLFEAITTDPLCNWVIEKYGLRIKAHNNAIEEKLIAEIGHD